MKNILETTYAHISSGLETLLNKRLPFNMIEDPDGYLGYSILDKAFIETSWPRLHRLIPGIENHDALEIICMTAIETRQSNNYAMTPNLLDCFQLVAKKSIKSIALKDALLNHKAMDWELIQICLQNSVFQCPATTICGSGKTIEEEAFLAKQWDIINLLMSEENDALLLKQFAEKLVSFINNKDKQPISDKDGHNIMELLRKLASRGVIIPKIKNTINPVQASSKAIVRPTKIGANISNNHFFLERTGRVYSNHETVNHIRLRILEGVPKDKVTSLAVLYKDDTYVEGYDTRDVSFCVIQNSSQDVPVFILPATSKKTLKKSDAYRVNYMNNVFNNCYAVWVKHCQETNKAPVPQEYCAATVVAGTKTMLGGDHFTAMVKPPGDNQWMHVDPTDFIGGPQRFNRSQCGGYSSMIEAEALMHYSSKTLVEAKNDKNQHVVIRSFWQFIDTIAFKFNTWFAGLRNEVVRNSNHTKVARGYFETTYAEMADFSAGRMARKFQHAEYIDERINESSIELSHDSKCTM